MVKMEEKTGRKEWDQIPGRKESILALMDQLISPSRPPSLLRFITLLGRLKQQKRTGWVLLGVPNPESVADHMYRMAMICMLNQDASISTTRCIQLCLVHDLAESIVGDITPFCGISLEDKHILELNAFKSAMENVLPESHEAQKNHLLELFDEYMAGRTVESQFVHQVDKLELLAQTLEYDKSRVKAPTYSQDANASDASGLDLEHKIHSYENGYQLVNTKNEEFRNAKLNSFYNLYAKIKFPQLRIMADEILKERESLETTL